MFDFFKNHSLINNASDRLLMLLNSHARDPIFFTQNGVNDDTDGRFELVAFFSTAIFISLSSRGELAQRVSQRLFDKIFKTFDDALRNLGVADTKVGPKIKKLAEHFYGRMGSYKKCFQANDLEALKSALARNLADNPNLSEETLKLLNNRFIELQKEVAEAEI